MNFTLPGKTELMPKVTFDQFLNNARDEADVFFDTYNKHSHKIDIALQECILSEIKAIEDDVINSLLRSYHHDTVSRLINEFGVFATHIKYAIHHVINEVKFRYYFGLFKDEAIRLKFEAIDMALSSLDYQIEKNKELRVKTLTNASKRTRPPILFDISLRLEKRYPDYSATRIWKMIVSDEGIEQEFLIEDIYVVKEDPKTGLELEANDRFLRYGNATIRLKTYRNKYFKKSV